MKTQSLKTPHLVPAVLDLQMPQMRLGILVTALVLYAFAGSPTPDAPGLAEAVIGALLIMAVPSGRFLEIIRFRSGRPLWFSGGAALLVFGLTLPLVAGLLNNNNPALMIRDVIPFIFLFLPLFFTSLMDRDQDFRLFLALAVIMGILFAFRSLDNIPLLLSSGEELTYFANAPTVLFALLFLTGVGLGEFIRRPSVNHLITACLAISLALIPLLAVSVSLQRASLGYLALYGFILAGFGLRHYPHRTFVLVALAFIGAWPFYAYAELLFVLLSEKTYVFGLNMRFEEIGAVWAALSDSVFHILFGLGWGGTFESPAVAGIRINYTHSLLSSMLLKTGVTGLVIALIYLAGLARLLWMIILRNPVLGFALAGPFIIDVFFYAAFKSLDFGVILLVLAAASCQIQGRRRVASAPELLYSL